MKQSGPIIDFFYGRSFSIHSQVPSVGTEAQTMPVADPDLQIRGRGGGDSLKKKKFGLKIGGGGASPSSATEYHHRIKPP